LAWFIKLDIRTDSNGVEGIEGKRGERKGRKRRGGKNSYFGGLNINDGTHSRPPNPNLLDAVRIRHWGGG